MDIFTLGIMVFIALAVFLVVVRIFFKGIFKIFSIIWFLLFVASLVYGLLVYADVAGMKKSCEELAPAILLEDDADVLAGFTFQAEGEPELLTNLEDYQEVRDTGNYKNMTQTQHCRIAYFDISAFDNVSGVDFGDGMEIPGDTIRAVLKAEDPKQELADYMLERESRPDSERQIIIDGIASQYEIDEKLKGAFFGLLFGKAVSSEGPMFLIGTYKDGKIKVYKETILFKTVKIFPSSLFESLADRAVQMQQVALNGDS